MDKMKVLVVDDEKIALDMLVSLCTEFEQIGEIKGFTNSKEALEYIKNNKVNLALLDIDMPVVDGITLAKEISSKKEKTNIIMTTAYSQYALDAYNNDCSGYLLKPISKVALQHQLENLRYPFTSKPLKCVCFGNFEIFFNNKPIKFNYNKTKELLAYLIDNNGALCSNNQIMAYLWEDDDNHSEYLKKLKLDLIKTFEHLDLKNVIIQNRGNITIDKSFFACDLFDYLDNGNKSLLNGDYMEQYSWAEYHKAQILYDMRGK